MNRSDWPEIIAAMRAGGYYDRIMAGGPEFDRVKAYLQAFAGQGEPHCASPGQNPAYPCFPGLHHTPFRDPQSLSGVALLERSCAAIASEALALPDDAPIEYTAGRLSPLQPRWTVYLFYHMGVNVEAVTRRCPFTLATIESLPRVCLTYPWGDALFSIQGPGNRLRAHCSIDNLRVRCHLGLVIPEGAGIRVGSETRGWTEGRGLLFEDSFEHEVWNHGATSRLVLIVDFWHPDLTDLEIGALTAGFRKAAVRRVFLRQRVAQTSAPERYLAYLEAEVARQEDDPLLREYWSA